MRSPATRRSARPLAASRALLLLLLLLAGAACGGGGGGDGPPAAGDGGVAADTTLRRGDGPPLVIARSCTAGAPSERIDTQIDPGVRQSASGTGGELFDTCDAAGNLTEQHCEVAMSCTAGPRPQCEGRETGKVVAKAYDCGGRCQDGACPTRCPAVDDGVDFRAVTEGGGATLQNRTDGRRYDCTLARDDEHDSFDCRTVVAGQTALVTGVALREVFCTAGSVGTLTLLVGLPGGAGAAGCAYACTLTPGR